MKRNGVEIISKTHIDSLGNLFFDVSVREGEVVTEKRLPVEEYLALFKSSLKQKEKFIEVPMMPDSILAASVSSDREDTFRAVVFYKAQRRAFLFMNQHYSLPFPALIAYIEVGRGVRKETELFALGTDEPVADTPLMHYPFGNVYDGGRCCYGNIMVQGLKNVTCAPEVLDAFLCGETNNDLWKPWRTKKQGTQGSLVEFLSGKEVFPNDILVNAKGTVGGLCERVCK